MTLCTHPTSQAIDFELRPLVASIAVKNGAKTTATTIIMTSQKARGLGNFIATDQFSVQR
jgi:hypothetical protein